MHLSDDQTLAVRYSGNSGKWQQVPGPGFLFVRKSQVVWGLPNVRIPFEGILELQYVPTGSSPSWSLSNIVSHVHFPGPGTGVQSAPNLFYFPIFLQHDALYLDSEQNPLFVMRSFALYWPGPSFCHTEKVTFLCLYRGSQYLDRKENEKLFPKIAFSYLVGAGFLEKILDCSSTKQIFLLCPNVKPFLRFEGESVSYQPGLGVSYIDTILLLQPQPKDVVRVVFGQFLSQQDV